MNINPKMNFHPQQTIYIRLKEEEAIDFVKEVEEKKSKFTSMLSPLGIGDFEVLISPN